MDCWTIACYVLDRQSAKPLPNPLIKNLFQNSPGCVEEFIFFPMEPSHVGIQAGFEASSHDLERAGRTVGEMIGILAVYEPPKPTGRPAWISAKRSTGSSTACAPVARWLPVEPPAGGVRHRHQRLSNVSTVGEAGRLRHPLGAPAAEMRRAAMCGRR